MIMLFNRLFIFKSNENGFYSVIDGVIAIFLIFILFFSLNSIIDLNTNTNIQVISDYNNAEELLEIMSSEGVLNSIYLNLENGNREESVNTALNFFDSLSINKNYEFKVNDDILVSKGNIDSDDEVNTAKRYFGEYIFSLAIS